jgi:hypothetical protein
MMHRPLRTAAAAVAAVVIGCADGEILPQLADHDASPTRVDAGSGTEGGPVSTLDGGGKDAGRNETRDSGHSRTDPRPPLPGEVLFVELMVNPGATVTDDAGEWIELSNATDASLELEGCVLDDDGVEGNQHVITSSILIAPHSVVVLAKLMNASDNGGVSNVAGAFGAEFSLSNGGGKVSLLCGGVAIDTVAFDTTWPYAEGVSMQLSRSAITSGQNDNKAQWCAAQNVYANGQRGSPGTTTDHCQ